MGRENLKTKIQAETELLGELINLPTKYYVHWSVLSKKEQDSYIWISRKNCVEAAVKLFRDNTDNIIWEGEPND